MNVPVSNVLQEAFKDWVTWDVAEARIGRHMGIEEPYDEWQGDESMMMHQIICALLQIGMLEVAPEQDKGGAFAEDSSIRWKGQPYADATMKEAG